MKRIIYLSVLLAAFLTFKAEARYQGVQVDFDYFYYSLAPYGKWVEIDYGFYAWKPSRVRNSWAPYKHGRWAWTSYGWYWDSFEPFGWATYHYGRWYYDNYYGWLWIPDYEWAPAWVEWRYDDYYIGWAPLSPYASFNMRFGIRFSFNWITPYNYYHFVRYNHFTTHNIYNYYVSHNDKSRIFSRTKYRNEYSFDNGRIINRGVDKKEIERRSGQQIRERDIVRSDRPRDLQNEKERNRDFVEVYNPTRDEVNKMRDRSVEVVRENRKSDLDIRKVDLSERRNNEIKERTSQKGATESPSTVVREERTNTQNERRIETPQRTATERRNETIREERSQGTDRNNQQDRNRTVPQVQERTNERRSEIPSVQQRENTVRNQERNNSGTQVERRQTEVPQRRETPSVQRQTEQKRETPSVQRQTPERREVRESTPTSRSNSNQNSRNSNEEKNERQRQR